MPKPPIIVFSPYLKLFETAHPSFPLSRNPSALSFQIDIGSSLFLHEPVISTIRMDSRSRRGQNDEVVTAVFGLDHVTLVAVPYLACAIAQDCASKRLANAAWMRAQIEYRFRSPGRTQKSRPLRQ